MIVELNDTVNPKKTNQGVHVPKHAFPCASYKRRNCQSPRECKGFIETNVSHVPIGANLARMTSIPSMYDLE